MSKDIEEFNIIINQQDLIGICRTPLPTIEYTLSSSAHGAYTKIDHILIFKKLNKIRKIEIIQSVFSEPMELITKVREIYKHLET